MLFKSISQLIIIVLLMEYYYCYSIDIVFGIVYYIIYEIGIEIGVLSLSANDYYFINRVLLLL